LTVREGREYTLVLPVISQEWKEGSCAEQSVAGVSAEEEHAGC